VEKEEALASEKASSTNNEEETKTSEAKNDSTDYSPLPTKTRKLIDFSNKVYVAPLSTFGPCVVRVFLVTSGLLTICCFPVSLFNI